jgi:ArsR family transcriptional regulator
MPVNKKEEFSKKEQELAAISKALSHPARIQILSILAKQNECVCGAIVEILPLAQSTVSQHLKELLNAGLIKGTVDGPRSCYCIDNKGIEKASKLLGDYFKNIQELQIKNSCC